MVVVVCRSLFLILIPYTSYGPLAHLVERIHGMDEVTGSSPVRSTVWISLALRRLADRWGVGVGCAPTAKTNGFRTFLCLTVKAAAD